MPGSDALIIGEFYLYNPGDRLLMLPDDPAVYYPEQRNGAITKTADGVFNFFNKNAGEIPVPTKSASRRFPRHVAHLNITVQHIRQLLFRDNPHAFRRPLLYGEGIASPGQ